MIRTRCPACLTVFRVRPEQLQARDGRVRCGHCFRPFDAAACALDEAHSEHDENAPETEAAAFSPEDQPDSEAGAATSPTSTSPPELEQPAPATPLTADVDALLDFTIPDSFRPERRPSDTVGEDNPTGAPPPSREVTSGEQMDPFPERRMRHGEDHLPSFEERLAALSFRDSEPSPHAHPNAEHGASQWRPATADHDDAEDLPLVVPAAIRRRRTPPETQATRPEASPLEASRADDAGHGPSMAAAAPAALELPEAWRSADTPTTERSPRTAQSADAPDDAARLTADTDEAPPDAWKTEPDDGGRRGLWGLGIGILLGMLVIQGAYVFREPIARNWPHARPILELACAQVGCEIPFARHAGEIQIDHSHLEMAHPDSRVYVLEARIRNRAAYPQHYPHLELTLTDVRDRPLARRVLAPSDWLPAAGENGDAFTARSEVHVMLPFAAPDVEQAAGYRLYAFYP